MKTQILHLPIYKNKQELINLIMSQNVIEGFWDENENTKIINNFINKDKINKINKTIKKLNEELLPPHKR